MRTIQEIVSLYEAGIISLKEANEELAAHGYLLSTISDDTEQVGLGLYLLPIIT